MGQKGNLRALARVFLEVVQGHPTTECFQFRQKCLMVFSTLFEVALKTISLFGCHGTLVVTKVLGGFFVSESVS